MKRWTFSIKLQITQYLIKKATGRQRCDTAGRVFVTTRMGIQVLDLETILCWNEFLP